LTVGSFILVITVVHRPLKIDAQLRCVSPLPFPGARGCMISAIENPSCWNSWTSALWCWSVTGIDYLGTHLHHISSMAASAPYGKKRAQKCVIRDLKFGCIILSKSEL
jgi:hypothetical protein